MKTTKWKLSGDFAALDAGLYDFVKSIADDIVADMADDRGCTFDREQINPGCIRYPLRRKDIGEFGTFRLTKLDQQSAMLTIDESPSPSLPRCNLKEETRPWMALPQLSEAQSREMRLYRRRLEYLHGEFMDLYEEFIQEFCESHAAGLSAPQSAPAAVQAESHQVQIKTHPDLWDRRKKVWQYKVNGFTRQEIANKINTSEDVVKKDLEQLRKEGKLPRKAAKKRRKGS